jgi:2-isopropylmalate synthase
MAVLEALSEQAEGLRRRDAVRGEAPGTVEIYDTTLRDGSQGEGVSYTANDKIRIAQRLDQLGVSYVEGGWPGSNPKDAEFFERAKDLPWGTAKIAAFGSTRRINLPAAEDPNLQALVQSQAPVCTIFGKTWTLHVTDVLRTSLDNNLRMIEESVAFLVAEGRHVIFDAEHFFDGHRADPSYALEALRAASRGGASTLTLCDTNGGSLPWQVEQTVRLVRSQLSTPLGIHAHDDTGCGVANSLAAVFAGAHHVQGTINGIGERCGNANLSVIIPNLELKFQVRALPPEKLRELTETSRFVAEIANLSPHKGMAYVGQSAFAHKGGVHVAAMRRHVDSYQHIDPAQVGNVMRVVVSDLAGRANVTTMAEELGVSVDAQMEEETLRTIKEAEARGLSYEGAEASVSLLMKRKASDYRPPFSVLDYQAMVGRRQGTEFVEATVRLRVGNEVVHTAGDGNGPVSALDSALRKALAVHYPTLEQIHLADYKVRILDSSHGTGAITRVLIDSHDRHGAFSTVGASANIIEASMMALVDALEFALGRS